MRITKANIYVLAIPFRYSFEHFLKKRNFSDSIVVEVVSDTGVKGYGEGVARPYVTGETVETCVEHIQNVLLPAIIKNSKLDPVTCFDTHNFLSGINVIIPDEEIDGEVNWNAARSAVEIAVIDCVLKSHHRSISDILPPNIMAVTYTGVLSASNLNKTIELANKCRRAELKYIKIKVQEAHDYERVKAVRDIMGPKTSIRLDANEAFSVSSALKFINSVDEYCIDCFEQPVRKANISDLAEVRNNSSIPIMADESIVTLDDAKRLVERNACDLFNLRISKCGGIYKTIKIAEYAVQNDIKYQMGCQVGETAILSAAGRHVAAHLTDIKFVEGSYSTLLLENDVSIENMQFEKGGKASVLTGKGLGITIKEDILRSYAKEVICVS